MGLDMDLVRRDDDGIEESVMYWRKANAIRRYFIEACGGDESDDGQEYPVTRYILDNLLYACEQLLFTADYTYKDSTGTWCLDAAAAGKEQPAVFRELAARLLPTQSGFFFGSTDYDLGYVDKLCYTANGIIDLLSEWKNPSSVKDDKGRKYFYTESW